MSTDTSSSDPVEFTSEVQDVHAFGFTILESDDLLACLEM